MKTYLYLLIVLFWASPAWADARSAVAMEVAEAVAARWGAQAVRSVPAFAARIETFAAKFGPEAYQAVRQVGPRAIELVEAAGVNGARATRMLAAHGEAGVALVLSRPVAMRQFVTFGEQAASVLVKHPGVAEKVIEQGGQSAVKALAAVGPQSGRRMAMLMEGELAQCANKAEVFEAVARHGDGAVNFLWQNKESLAVGTILAVFLANPEPFVKGAVALTNAAGENVVKPVVGGVFSAFNAVLWLIGLLIVAIAVLMWKFGVPRAETIKAARAALGK